MRQVPHPLPGLLERGVWKAPWKGPSGEIVLLVITSERKLLIPPAMVELGADHGAAADALWDTLDARDPLDVSAVEQLRRRSLRAI